MDPVVNVGYDSRFSIFQPTPIDISTDSELSVDYRPLANISRGQSIEFLIPVTTLYYTDLSRTILSVKVRLCRRDGTTVSADLDKVSFTQLPLSSMWRQCDVMLNQTLISPDVGINAGYKSVLDHLVYRDKDYLSSSAQTALFYYDTAHKMNTVDVTGEGTNVGLLNRYSWSKDGKEVHLQGVLPHDLSGLTHFIPSGVEIKVKLYPQSDEFALMTGSKTEQYWPEVVDATLKVRFVVPTNPVIIAHSDNMDDNPAVFPYMRSNIKSFTIPGGLTTWSVDQLYANLIPSELLICLVLSSSYTGKYAENPFNFAHHSLNYLDFSIEGNYGRQTFQPDFDNNDFTDSYHALYSDMNGEHRKGGIIELGHFNGGYAIYRIKISPGVQRSYNLGGTKRAQTRLSFRFQRSLPQPVTIVTYGRFVDQFRIDKSRNVYTDH